MDHSKQKLLLTLLIEFGNSFSKQINESAINQEMERYIRKTVRDFVERQYRGSVFDKEFKKLVKTIDEAKDEQNLVFNYHTNRVWTEISELSVKTTSFTNAYSIIDILGKNKDAFF